MSENSFQLRNEVKNYNSGFFKGDLNKIRDLIKHGANVNDIDEYDRTALHIACFDEKHVPDYELIETLIRCGGRVDLVNRYGENVLHLVCQNHYKDDVLELLLDCGADPNQKDFHGNTPMHVLVENTKQSVSFNTLKLFVKSGADVYALNKLNKNIFVYLDPQMNEDLQFFVKKCFVKLQRLKRALGLQQDQPMIPPTGTQNYAPPPLHQDLPSGSDLTSPIPLPSSQHSSNLTSSFPTPSPSQNITTGMENLSVNNQDPIIDDKF